MVSFSIPLLSQPPILFSLLPHSSSLPTPHDTASLPFSHDACSLHVSSSLLFVFASFKLTAVAAGSGSSSHSLYHLYFCLSEAAEWCPELQALPSRLAPAYRSCIPLSL